MIDFFQFLPLAGTLIAVVGAIVIIMHPLATDFIHLAKVTVVMMVGFLMGILALIFIAAMIARDLFNTP